MTKLFIEPPQLHWVCNTDMICTMCHGVTLALLIPKLVFFLILKFQPPPPPPLNHEGPSLGKKSEKLFEFISSKKSLHPLNATQKTSVLCKVPFLKIKKNCNTILFFEKLPFFAVYLDFSEKSTLQRAEVFFALHSVLQDPSFEL